MTGRWERSLPCWDAADRPRQLVVFISDHNRVGLQMPPGDSATVAPEVVHRLQQEIINAAVEANRRGGAA